MPSLRSPPWRRDSKKPASGKPGAVQTCREFSFKALVAIQERLVKEGRLVLTEMGPKSQRVIYVRTPDTRYPGED